MTPNPVWQNFVRVESLGSVENRLTSLHLSMGRCDFVCTECGKNLTRNEHLNKHRKQLHSLSPISALRPRVACQRCHEKKIRCERSNDGACIACRTAKSECSFRGSPSLREVSNRGPSSETTLQIESFPNTDPPLGNPPPVQDPNIGREETLKNYLAIYPRFPLIHPYAVPHLYNSALHQTDNEKHYLWGMVDALCSLICLAVEDDEKSASFYRSAREQLDMMGRSFVERVFICTILAIVRFPYKTLEKAVRADIDTASVVAREVSHLHEGSYIPWHGVDMTDLEKIIKDTFQRVCCLLLSVDYDLQRRSDLGHVPSLFTLDFGFPSPLDVGLFHYAKVETYGPIGHVDIVEPLHALRKSVELLMGHYIVGEKEMHQYEPANIGLKSPLLQRLYQYRYVQLCISSFWTTWPRETTNDKEDVKWGAVERLLSGALFLSSILQDQHFKQWIPLDADCGYAMRALRHAYQQYSSYHQNLIERNFEGCRLQEYTGIYLREDRYARDGHN